MLYYLVVAASCVGVVLSLIWAMACQEDREAHNKMASAVVDKFGSVSADVRQLDLRIRRIESILFIEE